MNPTLVLALAALFWGSSFYPTAVILERLSEGEYLLLRFCIATIVFGFLVHRKIAAASVRAALAGVFVGLILGAAFLSQTLAFASTNSSTVAFLTSTTIVFVPLFAFVFFRHKPTFRVCTAALIALIGLYLLSGAALLLGNSGELLALLCAALFAAHICFSEYFLKRYELFSFVFYQFFGAAVFLAAFLPFLDIRLELASFDFASVAFCAYGALVLTIFCFFAQNYAQKHLSATRVAMLLALEPLSAGLLGALMGENLGASGYLGAIFIIIGVIFS